MNNNLEYRACDLMDVKVDEEKRTIVGRAVVYNSMSNVLRTASGDYFREIILPGALRSSLETNDILAYVEHQPVMILGRRSANTLRVEDKEDGLYVEIDVPDTTYGRDLLVSAKRGDIKGFSFGFSKPKARSFSRAGEKIREISSLDLREVSIVSSPAYGSTTLSVRSEDFVDEKTEDTVRAEPIVETKTEVVIDHTRDLEIIKWQQRLRDINEELTGLASVPSK